MAALALFFFTALAGRLWCGYACPQTVWTQIFIWMERWVEGDRNAQKKLSAAAWSREKLQKRIMKQVLWIGFSIWTGFTLVGYFTPIRELGSSMALSFSGNFQLGPWETFWILFYAVAVYGNAGYLREQVCLYMCPYARFQSAMFDKNTLIISYDEERGEPRTKGKQRRENTENVGDCVDCSLCVQVCPTGIDIREGLQYECIACAACVDVCNQVMDKTGSPKHLIRYTSDNALEGNSTRIFRPRILVYATLLGSLFFLFAISITNINPLAVDIIRDRASLYRVVDNEYVENIYNFKVMNKGDTPMRVAIALPRNKEAVIGIRNNNMIEPGDVSNIPVSVQLPISSLNKTIESIEFEINTELNGTHYHVKEPSSFISP